MSATALISLLFLCVKELKADSRSPPISITLIKVTDSSRCIRSPDVKMILR